ncbi:hypothetical protein SBV1_270032 [Verrucomicrobia bacterium]|nr:hypothetical protein SBV1_270032 [Verrucomicrobiota bacterium]
MHFSPVELKANGLAVQGTSVEGPRGSSARCNTALRKLHFRCPPCATPGWRLLPQGKCPHFQGSRSV